jgi:DUF4097 and DUF4098 domain-containing protein YvlB
MRIIKIISALLFTMTSAAFADYLDNKQLSLDANNIREFVINCGAGSLQIQGFDSLKTIEVEAEIVIEGMSKSKAESFIEEHMVLSLEKKRNYARLNSDFEDSGGLTFPFFTNVRSLQINLIVKVPKDLMLDIEDGSGDIFVANINNSIIVNDGSGDMEIEGVIGELRIGDGSGEITLSDIEGNIRLDDGSGEIALSNIRGNVEISDGSGDIELEQITGLVDAGDGSGEIQAEEIDGSISVSDGSGEIDIRSVSGDIEIEDGSGNMEVAGVGGTVIIDDESGDIRVDSVKGDVEILDDGSGRCKITNVDGRVSR